MSSQSDIATFHIANAYSRWAPIYDALCGPVMLKGRRAAAAAACAHGGKILEVGVGTGLSFDDFVVALDGLNARGLRYAISYDGRTGDKSYGEPLPAYLGLSHVELEAGRSTQSTLLGREENTVESLYISPALAAEIGVLPNKASRRPVKQLELF